ncbi:MAG: glutathione peroxidase [Burkholderiales bacterium]|nr:glutathione peroxidase [Burkholderiales bacterium]
MNAAHAHQPARASTLAALLVLGATLFVPGVRAATPAATGAGTAAAAAAAQTPPAANACPALLNHTIPRLQDEKNQSLCQYAGRVLLVVNTASFCGFTGQYEGLEKLYARYKDKGLVVLGFPSNDFNQETGDNKQIADFCFNTYAVKFPMFIKTSVKGPQAAPFYKQLADKSGQVPRWNFYKYLIGRDGQVIDSYSSMTGPNDKKLVAAIEKQLAIAGK